MKINNELKKGISILLALVLLISVCPVNTVANTEIMWGDASDDGKINVLDAVLMKKHIAGVEGLSINLNVCDVARDGRVNVLDVIKLLKYIAGYDVSLDGSVVEEKTTAQVVREMGIGINLGNTFESCGTWINSSSVKNFETAWGSPVITEEMIQGMADEGFGVLRIPVAWSNMMDSEYNIHPDYIARVKEVVDWTLDSGMYAIVNIHYDSGWWEKFPTEKEECMKKYTAIWTQLCEAFGDYGYKLMFESLNEEGCWDAVWNRYSGSTSGKSTAYGLLNEINQTFVNIVRNSGENNEKRHLLIAGYATDITLTCDSYFKMPNDPQNRCAVSVHYYTPSTYTILSEDADWGKAKTEWGSASDVAELNKYMKMMHDTFVNKGIPVIVGEYGVPAMQNKTKENVTLYLEAVAKTAYDYGMCPVLWDTTSNYSYYNRYSCNMDNYSELRDALMGIIE